MQSLAVMEAGCDEAYPLTDTEIILMAASHSGESTHREAVSSILAKAGVQADALQCGIHPPYAKSERQALVRRGESAGVLHHNCSGKHAGMLLLQRYLGGNVETYLELDSLAQEAIFDAISRWCEIPRDALQIGVDGCAAPNVAIPLVALARGFASLAGPKRPGNCDGARADRLMNAILADPWSLAGEDKAHAVRLDTATMQACPGVVQKGGAETCYAACVPGKNLGIAIKISSGVDAAIAYVMTALLKAEGIMTDDQIASMSPWADPILRNFRGDEVGRIDVLNV
jgi:L-asparaginase II